MNAEIDWYEVIKQKEYLYIIRERLDKLEPRFFTTYINIYLIMGQKKALLVDTGTGLFPLKPLIDKLIENRKLIVINTHSHFDHRGANEEFEEVLIHSSEAQNLSESFDISFLKDSPPPFANRYREKAFTLKPPSIVTSIEDGYVFDLGNILLNIIHTPGHSPGSISILSDKNELFTGDTVHYGAIYLPSRNKHHIILKSLEKLISLYYQNENLEIYPSHEEYPAGIKLLKSLKYGLSKIDNIWETKKYDVFLEAWVMKDNYFTYVVEKLPED
jgi:glyoxylase-like metal-dependent hydrolase (beta-lactamase superfamily II)